MNPRRLGMLVAFGLVLAGLVFVTVAPATRQAVSGKLTISGSGTEWTLAFQNDASSTGPIKCWRYTFPPGVMAAGLKARPPGWEVGGNKPPPAPILGGRSATGIPPGGTASFVITTDKAFDTSGPPGVAAISEDCVSDGAASVAFGQAPPPPQPCECKKLRVEGKNYSSAQVNKGPTSLKLTLRWFLSCSAGNGKCVGKLKLTQPAGSDLKVVTPKNTTVTCNGKCDAAGATSSSGTVALRVTSDERLDFDNRRGKTVVFSIRRFCVRNGKDFSVGSTKLSLVFAGSGFLDKKKSDLNGNGKPDGSEKK